MDLDLNLHMDDNKDSNDRVKEATKLKQVAKFKPTWEQVWNGYDKPTRKKNKETGLMETIVSHKKGIWELKDSLEAHKQWLQEVKDAVDNGELDIGVPVEKFSKTRAKELYAILEERKRKARIQELIDHAPSNYYCITTTEQMEQLVTDLQDELETGLDTETTGLDVYVDEMVGLSITLPKHNYHVYVPFGHTTGEQQLPREYVFSMLKEYLLNSTKKFLHNAKFDRHMFLRHKQDLKGFLHDTQIAMRVLNENEMSYMLKRLLTKYKDFLGFEDDSYTFEQLFGKNAPFHEVPLKIAYIYACKDTHGTYLLGKWQEKFLNKQEGLYNIFYNIESPLLPIVVDMERNGMLIDVDFASEYQVELEEHINDLEIDIRKELGDINFNSPKQLAHWLYDVQKLDDITRARKTDKKTLKVLADDCPVLETLLKYRDLYKLNSTYISALPEKVKFDGRIHGQFNQDKTDTGRFSSQEPNLQNLPPRARKMIVAPEGKIIASIDYSQIEPRFLSHISGDESLRYPYIHGDDLYSTLAARVFHKPIEECGDGTKYRKMMKTGLLAVMYGTSMWTLAKQLEITVAEAEQFIEDFYQAYPRVKAWIESVWEYVKEHEFVQTHYGRKRRFPNHRQEAIKYDSLKAQICKKLSTNSVPHDFWDKKKYPQLPYKLKRAFQDVKKSVERVRRQAVNAIIQGSSADIMKMAMIELDKYCKKMGWKLIGTVHDEVLVEIDTAATHEQLIELNSCMKNIVQLDVPLKTDMELESVWGGGFKFDVTRKLFYLIDERNGETLFETPYMHEAIKLYKEVA